MKKYIYIATALLFLVACGKETEGFVETGFPGETVTLTATVKLDGLQQTKVAPNDTNSYGTGYNVTFKWQEGDTVLLVSGSNSSKFALKENSISDDGQSAMFIGKALPDMSSYKVFYTGKNIDLATYGKIIGGGTNDTTVELDNVEGGCNIAAMCNDGKEDGFTLNTFLNTFRLKLKGDATLGKVEYWCDLDKGSTKPLSVIKFGTDGMALDDTEVTEIWVPVTVLPTSSATFRFYDKNNSMLLEKVKYKNFASAYGESNSLISFSEVEVK